MTAIARDQARPARAQAAASFLFLAMRLGENSEELVKNLLPKLALKKDN